MGKTDARTVARDLRRWMNERGYLLEDINRAAVVLCNGLLGETGKDSLPKRKPVLGHVAFDCAPPGNDLQAMKKYLKMGEPC